MRLISDEVMFICYVLITLLVPQEVVGVTCVIEAFEDCVTNEEDRQVDLRNLTVGVLENGQWGVLGTADININDITLTTMEVTKCASKQEPETCMYFTTVRYKKGCEMLLKKDEMWSTFVQNTIPPLKCPMKGAYSFEKATVDMDRGKNLPGLDGCYWKVKTLINSGKKTVACFYVEVSTI